MKKLLTLTFLIIGMIMNAQQYGTKYGQRDKAKYGFITVGADIRNGLDGSKPTKGRAELDAQVKLGVRYNHVEVSMMYENFHTIDFQYYGVNVNYVTEVLKQTDIAFGIETGSIIRKGNQNFLTGGVNLELRYEIPKTPFILGLQGNLRVRTDNWKKGEAMPVTPSSFINITYKLNNAEKKINRKRVKFNKKRS